MKLLFDARWINQSNPDGITRFSRELIKKLIEDGVDLQLLVSSKDQLQELPKVKSILTNRPTSPRELGQSMRLNSHGFDVVYTPHYIFGGSGRNFPLIRTVHDLIPFKYSQKGAKLAWRLFHSNTRILSSILNNSDGIVTVSNAVKKELRGLTRTPIEVVYNAPFASRASNSSDGKSLLYIGRYERYKNVECLISAMTYLGDYQLLLAGNCSLQRQQELLPKEVSNVKFLGKISDSDYVEVLSNAFALVTASKEEGFGLPVVEAMAAGCPVICSDIDVFREVAGDAGQFFDPNKPKQLADCAKRLEDPKYRKSVAIKSIKNARRFNWTNSSDRLKSFLSDVCK